MTSIPGVLRADNQYKKYFSFSSHEEAYRSSFIAFLSQELRRQGFGAEAVKNWIEIIASRIYLLPCRAMEDGILLHSMPVVSKEAELKKRTKDSNTLIAVQLHLCSLQLTTTVTHSLCEALIRTGSIMEGIDNKNAPLHQSDVGRSPCELWSLSLADNALRDECVPPLVALLEKKKGRWCSWASASKEGNTILFSEEGTTSRIWFNIFEGNKFSPSAVSLLQNVLETLGEPPSDSILRTGASPCVAYTTVQPIRTGKCSGAEINTCPNDKGYHSISSTARLEASENENDVDLNYYTNSTPFIASSVGLLPRSNATILEEFRKRALLLLSTGASTPRNDKEMEPRDNMVAPREVQEGPHKVNELTALPNALLSPFTSTRCSGYYQGKKGGLQKVLVSDPSLTGGCVLSSARSTEDWKSEEAGNPARSTFDNANGRRMNDLGSECEGMEEKRMQNHTCMSSGSSCAVDAMFHRAVPDDDHHHLAHRYQSLWTKGGVVNLSNLTIDAASSQAQEQTPYHLLHREVKEYRGMGILNRSSAENFSALSAVYNGEKNITAKPPSDSCSVKSAANRHSERKTENTPRCVWDVLALLKGHRHIAREGHEPRFSPPLLHCAPTSLGLSVITVLDLSRNGLSSVPPGALPQTLLRLDLSHNALCTLENGAWIKSCRMLAVLNLRYNKLGYVTRPVKGSNEEDSEKKETKIVSGERRVKKKEKNDDGSDASLGPFPYTSPLKGAFENTPRLTHLFLGHNYLKKLDGISVSHLLILHTLDVSYNRLSNLNVLRPLSLCHSLYQLIIKGNPLPFPSVDGNAFCKPDEGANTQPSRFAEFAPNHDHPQDATKTTTLSSLKTHSLSFHASHLRPVLRNMLPQLFFVDDINLQNLSSNVWKGGVRCPEEELTFAKPCKNPYERTTMRDTEECSRSGENTKNEKINNSELFSKADCNKEQKGDVDSKMYAKESIRSSTSRKRCSNNEEMPVRRDENERERMLMAQDDGPQTSRFYSSAQHESFQHRALLKTFSKCEKNAKDAHKELPNANDDGLGGCQEQEKTPLSSRRSLDLREGIKEKTSREAFLRQVKEKTTNYTNHLRSSSPDSIVDSPSTTKSSFLQPFYISKGGGTDVEDREIRAKEVGKDTDGKNAMQYSKHECLQRQACSSKHLSLRARCEKWREKLEEDRKEVHTIISGLLSTIEKQQAKFFSALNSDTSASKLVVSFFKSRPKLRTSLLHERIAAFKEFHCQGDEEGLALTKISRRNYLLASTAIPKTMVAVLQYGTGSTPTSADGAASAPTHDVAGAYGENLRAVLFACEDAKACLRCLVHLLKVSSSALKRLENIPDSSAGWKTSINGTTEKLFRKASEVEIQLFKSITVIRRMMAS